MGASNLGIANVGKRGTLCHMALSAQQAKYCLLRSSGETTQSSAYLGAYPKATKHSAGTLASLLEMKPKIQAELKRLQSKTETSTTLSRQEKREFLARVVRANLGELDESSDLVEKVDRNHDKDGNRIKTTIKLPGKAQCIEIDNRMAGHNEPEEHKHTIENGVMLVPVGGPTLNDWEKEAAKQQERLKAEAVEKD